MATFEQLKRRFDRGMSKPHIYLSADRKYWIAHQGHIQGRGGNPDQAFYMLRLAQFNMSRPPRLGY